VRAVSTRSKDCPACDVDHPRGDPECPGRRIGQVFRGKYELLRVIGCGGMGVVYEATHVELGRSCALKLMRASLGAHAGAAARFASEARQIAALDHPGIVRIFDSGRDDDGTLYIEMELLAGESVEAWAGSRPSVAEAVDVIARALEPLAEAHRAGIIHRDIKPDNIFLARAGSSRRVVLLDFGIARAETTSDPRRTEEGALLGTLAFMSPEQFADTSTVDRRTDVFAMAATLFRILAGRPPIDGTRAEVMRALAARDYPRSLRALGVDVPVALDRAIAAALDPDRERRPADAAALRAQLLAAPASRGPAQTELEEAPARPAPAVRGTAVTELEDAAPSADTMPARSTSIGGAATPAHAASIASAPSALDRPAPRSRATIAIAGAAVLVVGGGVAVWQLLGGGTQHAPIDARPLDARPLDARPADAPIDASPPAQDMVRIAGATFVDGYGPRDAFLQWCRANGETAKTCDEMFARVEPREVTVATFDLDRYEVAQEAFSRWLIARADGKALAMPGCGGITPPDGAPIVCVTHAAADAYCRSIGRRLPTSDEWSLAAGVAAGRRLPWGADNATCTDAVYARLKGQRCEAPADGPAPVAIDDRDVTPEGVHALGGNVSEWVDASSNDSFLARGGNWAGTAVDLHPARRLKVARDDRERHFLGAPNIGFRCATSLPRYKF
jgi:serine/threonine-protein kinase